MPRPLRVLFLMEDLCFGGTQRQTLELARRLDRRRFVPVMLILTGPTDLDAAAREAGVELHHMGRTRRVSPLFFIGMGMKLRELNPDLIVPCTALPNIWGRIWGKLAWIGATAGAAPRIVGTCRGGGGPARQHERLFWRLTDHMICNSEVLRDILSGMGVPPPRLSYIPNGVDTAFFVPSAVPPSQKPHVLLCVARLARDKDHLTLLRAFALVLQRYPSARLRIVGDGPEKDHLHQWAVEHEARHVDFVPGGLDMREYYDAARIFVLSSVREGQPNVILEAMSCGLPVCATAVGGIPRLVEEGKSGFLSPAGDAAALAENCCRLLAEGDLCDSFGQVGRERVERKFSFTAMVDAHQNVFSILPVRMA